MSLWTGPSEGVSLLMLSTLSCFFLGSIQSISPCLGWSLRKYPSYGLMNHEVLLLETDNAIETSGCVAAGPRGRSAGDLQGCALRGREGAPGSGLPVLLLRGTGAAPGALLVPGRPWEGAEGLGAAGWRQEREGAGGCRHWHRTPPLRRDSRDRRCFGSPMAPCSRAVC